MSTVRMMPFYFLSQKLEVREKIFFFRSLVIKGLVAARHKVAPDFLHLRPVVLFQQGKGFFKG